MVIETGRMHQIRVHMAHIGNPILGDLEGDTFRDKLQNLYYGISHAEKLQANRGIQKIVNPEEEDQLLKNLQTDKEKFNQTKNSEILKSGTSELISKLTELSAFNRVNSEVA